MPVHVGKLHKESFENAINLLKEEKSIGIFPEGTRNKTDQLLLPLRKGTTLLAKKQMQKIIPFAITGKYRPFGGLTIEFGEPIDVTNMDTTEANTVLTEKIMDLLLKRIGDKKMKYIFIVNPESAKGNAMKIIGNIEKVCKQEHIEYEVCYTLAQGDATRLAQSYKDDENIIYAVGGDGTLSEVLNGVIGTKNKIGIIPAGSGNDFYRTVKELAKAEIESDVGVVNGKYFLNIACVGIDA